mmetsp:Transcript_4848/g.7346  ORF Transcript_4848/g.7346 Transcript_4848/m.7346 type:complete len:149 (+) Transcript_4848:193-639(+)
MSCLRPKHKRGGAVLEFEEAGGATGNTLPLSEVSAPTCSIESGISSDDALAHLKYIFYPFVNTRLQAHRQDGQKKETTNPLLTKSKGMYPNYVGSNKTTQSVKKVLCPSLASNLGISDDDWNMLKKTTNRRWKNENLIGFPMQDRMDR